MEVHSLLQDRTGFIWIGTSSGLYRYDGLHFRGYTTADGLPDDWIESMHETASGILLVGTQYGLVRRDGESFKPILIPGTPAISSQQSVTSNPQGLLYVGTSQGLYIGQPVGVEYNFRLYPNPPQAGGIAAYGLFIDSTGDLWFGCGTALCALAKDGVTGFGREDGVPPGRWDAILADPQGNLWIRNPHQVRVRRPGSARFAESLATSVNSATASSVSLHLDPQGRLILPTESGLLRRRGLGWERIAIPQGLPTNPTCCVLADREGSVWVGLAGAGLARWVGYNEWESWTASEGLLAVLILERQGHRVTPVQNGREALTAVEHQAFDLVLIDVQMPEMDGIETSLLIRERENGTGRHIPIVAMTAQAMEGDREKCLAAGMDAYVSKPIRLVELLAAIAACTAARLTTPG